jgi:starch-binding outer membrane protein, SusD/RagB family
MAHTMHKLIRIPVLMLLITCTACDDWLTLKPQDTIIKQDYWQTKEQVRSAVMGCYASLLGNPGSSGGISMTELLFLWGELRGDMLAPALGISDSEFQVINGNILPSNPIVDWRPLYRTINYCNTVLKFAPDVLKSDKTFKQEALDAYIAEVLALRSLMYFYLVRNFGEVPLLLEPTVTDTDIVSVAKSSQQTILDQIAADLLIAAQSAPVSYGSQSSNKGRITKYAVHALQADVYLWMEQYDQCIAACDKIIQSGQVGLMSRFTWFNEVFVEGNSDESIFEFQFDQQKTNPFYLMFRTGNIRKYVAATRVLDVVYTLDYEDPDNYDERGIGASVRGDGTIWKYLGLSSNTSRTEVASYAHWIVYRYPEILLMKAEALAYSGGGQQALDLIEQVRVRSNALDATKQDVDPADAEGIINYILDERAREFAFEGKRWYDVLRCAKRNNFNRQDLLINLVVQGAPPDRQQSIIQKYYDHNSLYLPIHQEEINKNRLLVQNTFYLK